MMRSSIPMQNMLAFASEVARDVHVKDSYTFQLIRDRSELRTVAQWDTIYKAKNINLQRETTGSIDKPQYPETEYGLMSLWEWISLHIIPASKTLQQEKRIRLTSAPDAGLPPQLPPSMRSGQKQVVVKPGVRNSPMLRATQHLRNLPGDSDEVRTAKTQLFNDIVGCLSITEVNVWTKAEREILDRRTQLIALQEELKEAGGGGVDCAKALLEHKIITLSDQCKLDKSEAVIERHRYTLQTLRDNLAVVKADSEHAKECLRRIEAEERAKARAVGTTALIARVDGLIDKRKSLMFDIQGRLILTCTSTCTGGCGARSRSSPTILSRRPATTGSWNQTLWSGSPSNAGGSSSSAARQWGSWSRSIASRARSRGTQPAHTSSSDDGRVSWARRTGGRSCVSATDGRPGQR